MTNAEINVWQRLLQFSVFFVSILDDLGFMIVQRGSNYNIIYKTVR